MKKTIYRIELRSGANSVCETIAIMAAKSNGGTPVTLEQLKMIGEER